MDRDTELDLIRRAQAGDREAAGEIVGGLLPFLAARARAYKLRGCPLPLEDLMQEAAIALMQVIGRFDPARGLKLTTFAQPRVDGAMRDYCRQFGYFLKGGQRTGRTEGIKSLSAKAIFRDGGDEDAYQPSTHDRPEWLNLDCLDDALKSCRPRNREIMRLRFAADMTMVEIAKRFEVAESRISQIISQELARLREMYANRLEVAAA